MAKKLDPETEVVVEPETPTPGENRSSRDLANWEKEEIATGVPVTAAVAPPAPAEAEETENTLSALEREAEAMTAAEAEQILADLTEYEGRLSFTVKRRGVNEEETLYVRLPDRAESRECERRQVALLHRLRTGTKEANFEDRIPTLAEFVNDLYEHMPVHQKTEIDRIQADPMLSVTSKNVELLNIFAGSAYFTLIQNTAEVLANDRYNSEMASRVVERRAEDGGFDRAYVNVQAFDEEDIDVSNDIIRSMLLTHQKLQSARFLRSSSDALPDGDSSGN
jgi:hypothetical protein